MSMNTHLSEVFELVASRFAERGIDTLLIGGFAVNHYGYSRNTMDIDFMLASHQENEACRLMRENGYTNISKHETVIFVQKPESSLRVDFLKVDKHTMTRLLASSSDVEYLGHSVRLPSLEDLIAMKIFSLKTGGAKREAKDYPDIAYLAVLNNWNTERQLRPLCDQFGTPEIYERLCKMIKDIA